jgi:hypothetical protein
MRNVSMSRALLAVVAAGVLLAALPVPAAAQGTGPYQYYSLTPCRIFDTRVSTGATAGAPILATGTTRTFVVQGKCGVPVGAKAVSVNLTAVAPNGAGYLTLFPSGITRPVVSSLNFNVGEPAVGNGALVPIADQGTYAEDLSVYTKVAVTNGTVHAVLDVTGYFGTAP